MRAFVIKRSDIDRCPSRSWLAGHWRDDGTCLHELPAALRADAEAQVCGRLELDDVLAIAGEAYDRGQRGEHHSPAGLLLVCCSNPRGIGWRLNPGLDLRPLERAAMRGLAMRAFAAGEDAALPDAVTVGLYGYER